MITPPFTVSNRISPTLTTATLVKNIKNGYRMVGSNLAVLGNVMTLEEVLTFVSFGQNLARAHHLATAIKKGWMTVDQVSNTWDLFKANGVRTCIDLVENLGENTPWGLRGFKQKLCEFDPEAEEILKAYIQEIAPLLRHPALFMVGIINECVEFLDQDIMRKLRARWVPIIKSYNPHVMVYTTNDFWVSPKQDLLNVIVEEDAFCANFYGGVEDFQSDAKPSWMNEWQYRNLKWWIQVLKDSGNPKPVFITEFGSYSVNPHYVENEISMHVIAAAEGWSVAVYAYSTGSDTDRYSIQSDPRRKDALLFGGYLNKNRTGLSTFQEDNRFEATGTKISMPNRHRIRVGSYVWDTIAETPAAIAKVVQ